MKCYDLNVFYREEFDKENEVYLWSDNLFIHPYLYVADSEGSRRFEGELFELTEEESLIISPEYPTNEFGTDWWVDMEVFFTEHPDMPQRVKDFLRSLPDPESIDTSMEPTWWIRKDKQDDMLF